ncbi:hypothetical protein [Streptomyces sp. ISL-10]|uniref:hypothetical protein n=1 Tax=Streptomyces sp. ISL-10 TaxID=2819172 RepID=UPI001BEC5C98|nr:hypothetical protein [Streptomyces sp. ISL-10]
MVSAFRSGSKAKGFLLFAAYAAGMPVTVGAAALSVALTRTARVQRLRRLGGGLLFLVGAYVAYYGRYEIRVLRGSSAGDPVIDATTTMRRWIAETLDAIGVPLVAALFAGLLLATLPLRRRRHDRTRDEPGCDNSPTPGRAQGSPGVLGGGRRFLLDGEPAALATCSVTCDVNPAVKRAFAAINDVLLWLRAAGAGPPRHQPPRHQPPRRRRRARTRG